MEEIGIKAITITPNPVETGKQFLVSIELDIIYPDSYLYPEDTLYPTYAGKDT
ncbi:hypothetical protein Ana3638_11965 [Anaerocolumna sedimenticola]|uniref:Uncharacterized protein n=1 Tax=Anaerocolumna sedimenticola TaxID=2696063 RepID=A0A6P1TND4_9FIRM|nr:hypothetical protein [Anaerocolumna sedimenticola]QHQ61401.1 hypothetical protein Ana3638_11965 [Anaerocolumna sedimenticola]